MTALNISNFIWRIADDVLRDVYVRGKYRDVILPMTVIRRLDAVLEPTKQAVLDAKQQLDAANITNQERVLRNAANQAFYNASPFRLRDLTHVNNLQQLRSDFEEYLDGFSPNVQEVLDKFQFRNQIPTLIDSQALGYLLEKFLDPSVNLSPDPVLNGDGSVRLEGLDNHSMGTVFEELIRRFSEDNNEEAGEHFTPRDVVQLMARLIFLPIADAVESGTYLIYDGACGTGGMLTVAEETLNELAQEQGKAASIHLYGQEVNPETYAIAKADLILKGEGDDADNMAYGSTLAADGFPRRQFDFMLSNPPYGKSWKSDLDRLGGKSGMIDPRFVVEHAGDPEHSLVTRVSDGQMMFLANMLSKMKQNSPLGSRIAEVHNGSSLFTGDAGQGESNIRRWIIENDWLEAIVALPLNMFYNTGIATYIWVLSNRKAAHRRGYVQLIDASEWHHPLRRNLGNKNCELNADDIRRICDAFINFEETEQSKIFPNSAFGYWKVTVERPLRLSVDLSHDRMREFQAICGESDDMPTYELVESVTETTGAGPHLDYNDFSSRLAAAAGKFGVRLTAKRKSLIRAHFADRDPEAAAVIKRQQPSTKTGSDPIHGLFAADMNGNSVTLEYEPDPELRDTEQIPLMEEGGIEAFLRREVLPYAPDAWYSESSVKIGYEISFNRHFYKPTPMRTLDEIRADILALEQETEGLLAEVVGSR